MNNRLLRIRLCLFQRVSLRVCPRQLLDKTDVTLWHFLKYWRVCGFHMKFSPKHLYPGLNPRAVKVQLPAFVGTSSYRSKIHV